MRKTLIKILFLVLLTCTLAFAGCDCGNCNGDNGGGGKEEETINLYWSAANITLTVDDSRTLDVYNNQELLNVADVEFSSSNSSVATVDSNGKILAIKSGTANIIAEYKNETAECSVEVNLGGKAPEINFLAGAFENYSMIAIPVKDSLTLTPNILFNGKYFDDGEFEYSMSEELGTIDKDGVFTAGEVVGETVVTVNATWRGETLISKEVNLKINNPYSILVNGQPFYTFSKDAAKGDNVESLEANVFDFEVEISDSLGNEIPFDLVLEENEGIIEWDDQAGKITPIKFGQAKFAIKEKDEDVLIRNVIIKIEAKIFEKLDKVYNIDAASGAIPEKDLATIFSAGFEAKNIVGLNYDGDLYTADEDGNIIGLPAPTQAPDTEYVEIFTPTYGFRVPAKIYGKVVRTADDLAYFNLGYNGSSLNFNTLAADVKANLKTFNSYYIVENDIDFNNATIDFATLPHYSAGDYYTDSNLALNGVTNYGLKGTFDGQGHTIKNFKAYAGGIFGVVTGVIKNIAFKDVVTEGAGIPCVFANRITSSATVSDIYINIKTINSNNFATLSAMITDKTPVNNCVFVVENADLSKGTAYSPVAIPVRNTSNSYSKETANAFAKFENVIVISNAPLSTQVSSVTNYYLLDALNVENTPNFERNMYSSAAGGMVDVSLEYAHIQSSGVVRYNTTDEFVANKGLTSAMLDTFDKDIWSVSDGVISWKNSEHLMFNNAESTDISLYLTNEYGLPTEAVAKYLVGANDRTSDLTLEIVEGTSVTIENKVTIKALSVGTTTLKVKLLGSELATVTVTVKDASVLKTYSLVKSKSGSSDVADGDEVVLYYSEQDVSANFDIYAKVVLTIENVDYTSVLKLELVDDTVGKEVVTISGGKMTAAKSGTNQVKVSIGDHTIMTLNVKVLIALTDSDFEHSGDLPASWID